MSLQFDNFILLIQRRIKNVIVEVEIEKDSLRFPIQGVGFELFWKSNNYEKKFRKDLDLISWALSA